jgi:hypothetical protein
MLAAQTNSIRSEEYRLFATPEKIMEVADELDDSANGGKGSKYLHDLQER